MRITVDGSAAVAVTGRVVSVSSASSPSSAPRATVISAALAFGVVGLERERAFLDHIAGVGRIAGREQHLAAVHVAALGADRQDAQRVAPEDREARHPLQEGDVVLDRHSRG